MYFGLGVLSLYPDAVDAVEDILCIYTYIYYVYIYIYVYMYIYIMYIQIYTHNIVPKHSRTVTHIAIRRFW